MANKTQFGRLDNFGTVASVTPNLAVQATATLLSAGHNICATVATSAAAVRLPYGAGAPITVYNNATAAAALSVFPPLMPDGSTAAGGKIYGAAAAPSANAAVTVADTKTAMFVPMANGIDWVVIKGA